MAIESESQHQPDIYPNLTETVVNAFFAGKIQNVDTQKVISNLEGEEDMLRYQITRYIKYLFQYWIQENIADAMVIQEAALTLSRGNIASANGKCLETATHKDRVDQIIEGIKKKLTKNLLR